MTKAPPAKPACDHRFRGPAHSRQRWSAGSGRYGRGLDCRCADSGFRVAPEPDQWGRRQDLDAILVGAIEAQEAVGINEAVRKCHAQPCEESARERAVAICVRMVADETAVTDEREGRAAGFSEFTPHRSGKANTRGSTILSTFWARDATFGRGRQMRPQRCSAGGTCCSMRPRLGRSRLRPNLRDGQCP